MCYFLPEWHFWPGRRPKYNILSSCSLRRLIFQCFSPSNILSSSDRVDGFHFPSIYGPPYPNFQLHLLLLLLNVLLALLLVGSMSRLYILCRNCKDGGVYTILGHVEFCWGLDTEEIHQESQAAREYCPDIICITLLFYFISHAFDIGQTYCGEILGIILYHPTQSLGADLILSG